MPRPALALLALLALLACAAPAAAQTTVPVRGVAAAGPSQYDRTFVTKIGPSSAKTVLVLVPGYSGGAGNFTLVGRDIVDRVPGLQVWAVDRRSQALEDSTYFERGLRGEVTPQQVFDHYIGWITDPSIQPRYQPPDPARLRFVSEWGLPTALGDLRRVIRSAATRSARRPRRSTRPGTSPGRRATATSTGSC